MEHQHNTRKYQKKRHTSWNVSISKIVDNLPDDHAKSMTDTSKLMMNDIINQLNNTISKLAARLCSHTKRHTLKSIDIETAVKLSIPPPNIDPDEVNRNIIDKAKRTVELYKQNAKGVKGSPKNRTVRAGLLLSVSKIENILKHKIVHRRKIQNKSYSKGRISNTSGIFLASIIENLVTIIIKGSSDACIGEKRSRITPKHIAMSIRNNPSINLLFKRHNILGGSVIPMVQNAGALPPGMAYGIAGRMRHRRILRDNIQGITKPAIRRLLARAGIKSMSGLVYEEFRGIMKLTLEKIISSAIILTEQRKAKTVTYNDYKEAADMIGIHTLSSKNYPKQCNKRKRKKHVETDTDSDVFYSATENDVQSGGNKKMIRKMQKTNCLIFPESTMIRLIKEISNDYNYDIRHSKTGLVFVHALIEEMLTKLAMDANLCAQHAGRLTVQPRDFNLARRIRGDRD